MLKYKITDIKTGIFQDLEREKKKAFIDRVLILWDDFTKRFHYSRTMQRLFPLTRLFLSPTFILNLSLLWETVNPYR